MTHLFQQIANQGINWSLIWQETGFTFCLVVFTFYALFILWATRNWKAATVREYDELLEKRNTHSINQGIHIEMYRDKNDELSCRFEEAKADLEAARELNAWLTECNNSLREELDSVKPKHNAKGQFDVKTGKGHQKKKQATQTEKDWTKATEEELLAEAKKRYPVGTKYFDVLEEKPHKALERPFKYTYSSEFAIAVNYGGGFVYRGGKWAKIVTNE